MKKGTKEMAAATVLAAMLVITLVLTSNFIASYLGGQDSMVKAYATGATIQDDASATEDFIAETLKSGGVCIGFALRPWIYLMFENGTEYYFSMVGQDYNWMISPRSTGFNFSGGGPEKFRASRWKLTLLDCKSSISVGVKDGLGLTLNQKTSPENIGLRGGLLTEI